MFYNMMHDSAPTYYKYNYVLYTLLKDVLR